MNKNIDSSWNCLTSSKEFVLPSEVDKTSDVIIPDTVVVKGSPTPTPPELTSKYYRNVKIVIAIATISLLSIALYKSLKNK